MAAPVVAQSVKAYGTTPTTGMATAATNSAFLVIISGPSSDTPTVSDNKGNSYATPTFDLIDTPNGCHLKGWVVNGDVSIGGSGHIWTAAGLNAQGVITVTEFTGTGAVMLDADTVNSILDATSAYQITTNGTIDDAASISISIMFPVTGGNPVTAACTDYTLVIDEENNDVYYTQYVFKKTTLVPPTDTAVWTSSVDPNEKMLAILVFKSTGSDVVSETANKKPVKRRRQSSTFDFTAAGWFNSQIAGTAGAGVFDRDMAYPASAGAYSLTADAGTFSLTGVATGLRAARKIVAAPGTFSFTGNAAALLFGLKLTAAPGTFNLTGVSAGLLFGRKLSAAAGTFSFTGNSAALLYGLKLSAAAGVFNLTGNAANFSLSYRLAAAAGTFSLSGQDAGARATRSLAAGVGSFTLSGVAAALLLGKTLAAAQGTFSLSGQAVALSATRKLSAESGAYALTGYAALLLSTRTMQGAAGVYSFTGNNAGLHYGRVLGAGTGVFALNGQDLSFNGAVSLAAQTGAFVLSGVAAGVRVERRLSAASGSFALSGSDTGLQHGRLLGAGQGAFDLVGIATGLNVGKLIAALSGTFVLSGKPINLNYSSGIDYGAIAEAVWAYVLPNGKTAAENAVETLALLEALIAAPGCLDVPIEGALTGSDLLRIIAAVQAGKSTIASVLPGTAHVEFAAVDGVDIRVAAEMDGSERTDVTVTL